MQGLSPELTVLLGEDRRLPWRVPSADSSDHLQLLRRPHGSALFGGPMQDEGLYLCAGVAPQAEHSLPPPSPRRRRCPRGARAGE